MRTVASYIDGHLDGLRFELEHVLAGRLDTSTLTAAERDRAIGYRYALARLEQIRNERLADVDAEVAQRYLPTLLEEKARAYRSGLVEGLSAAIGVVDTRVSSAGRGIRGNARRAALLALREALTALEDHHAAGPTSGGPQ